MDEATVKVKQEKFDEEVERKIQELQNLTKCKEEADEKDSNDHHSSSSESEEVEDKKDIQPVKSSNELLAELFQVFNAAPPEELLNDEDLIKKAQRIAKKVKKEKKKKRNRHKEIDKVSGVAISEAGGITEGEKSDSNEPSIKKEKHKHKKKKKHKHKDVEKDKVKEKERTRSKSKEKEKEKSKNVEENSNKTIESLHREKDDSRQSETTINRKRQSTFEKIAEPPPKKQSTFEKRSVNSFYNGYKDYEKDRESRIKSERRRESSDIRENRRLKLSSRDHRERHDLTDISLSDEETYLREREQIGGSSMERRHRHQNYQRTRSRYSSERYKRRTRSRSRNRSRSRDLGIDKKRLLEIARKNAISMFKRGNLPGCANMSEDVKDKVLLQMRYGGRTVQDLTDFCRKISNGEPLSSMSSDNDSDIDKEGNTKAFHHPFQLKERDPIVLQLHRPNSIILPAVAKTEILTKAITMQFPVSSGQQHRISESWMPVVKKPEIPALPAATQSTNLFKTNVQKNVFEKTLPISEQQVPAFKPLDNLATNSKESNAATTSTTIDTTVTCTNDHQPATQTELVPTIPIVSAEAAMSEFIPDVAIPSSNVTDSVFPKVDLSAASVDVSSIISKRLSALRRLQENPMDSEAIKMMYNSQKAMSSWASSKHMPGQFTGSTGVNVLKAHELNSGPQVWARRDQLTSTKPVTGGMGMHLLQKMGWKPGEGLGREKTGALHPLLLDVKLDKRGLVAKDDHAAANGQRNVGKKRANNLNDAMQSLQNKHPVCVLNELSSKRRWTPPLYEVVSEGGPSHSKKFLFSVSMNGQTYTPPVGSNTKKEAKMIAAKFCLEQMGVLPAGQ